MKLSLPKAARFIEDYKSAHTGVGKIFDMVYREVDDTGGVKNFFGRFMPVDADKPYVGVDYKIQSTAADLLKMRMVDCWKLLQGKQSSLIMTVHDELIFDIHDSEKHLLNVLHETMEEPDLFEVPLTCSIKTGLSWGTAVDRSIFELSS